MSEIRELIAFHEAIADATDEREAAYETREIDRERWDAAKHNYAAIRTYFRLLNRELGLKAKDGEMTIQPDSISPEIAANGKEIK
jgi:hypothetical protein